MQVVKKMVMDENIPGLPGHCTEITAQKKKSDRVSLFVDDRFLAGFYRYAIKQAGVRIGSLITEETYKKLLEEEERYRLREQIYRWLSVRDQASGELREKSRAKGYATGRIEEVIHEFINKGLLDDQRYAGQFAETKYRSQGWGPLKIRAALSQKGIKKHYIDSALDGLFADQTIEDDLVAAAQSVKLRLLRTEPGIRRKKKLTDFLIRRGFPGHVVYEKSDTVLKQLENEET